jgi:hypothetical protein
MNLFTAGLSDPMCSNIEMQWPVDLQITMSLVRAFQRRTGAPTSTPLHSATRHVSPISSGGQLAHRTFSGIWMLVVLSPFTRRDGRQKEEG